MIGHQREVLAGLGIDLWVPRSLPSQQNVAPSIWRDQNSAERISEIIVPQVQPNAEITIERPLIQKKNPHPTPSAEIVTQPIQQEVVTALKEEIVRETMHVDAFQLQAITLAHCALVIDASSLSAEQQQLWQNIVQALPAQKYALNWPFPLLNLQDGRGVQSYIQGFFDGLSQGKTVIALGAIPNANGVKFTQVASLQEMLDQSLLKKELWQMMRVKQPGTE
ncbi:hypothetical protein [Acinetobacter sp. WCHAc060042]|uniref:hypothetical protein n=1 Tax=Acinetobacter sp. WCHAc060042 TaxID=2213016 RepID=UPI000DA68020|nr:hypothetical protein [Acinetobacter sp. WCHAc060042]